MRLQFLLIVALTKTIILITTQLLCAQTTSPPPTTSTSPTSAAKRNAPPVLVQLRVVYHTRNNSSNDDKETPKPVALHRFYLLREAFDQKLLATTHVPTRAETFKEAPDLLAWLERNNCESVYCRSLNAEDVRQVAAFRAAYARGQKRYGATFPVAWLTMFLDADLRVKPFRQREQILQALLAKTFVVARVMTNEKGTAYFFNVPPGKYFVSNILPVEFGAARLFWNKEITVKNPPKTGLSPDGQVINIGKDAIDLNAAAKTPSSTDTNETKTDAANAAKP